MPKKIEEIAAYLKDKSNPTVSDEKVARFTSVVRDWKRNQRSWAVEGKDGWNWAQTCLDKLEDVRTQNVVDDNLAKMKLPPLGFGLSR